MPTFRPPVSATTPSVSFERGADNRLMRHYGPRDAGRNVYLLTDGTITETQPASWQDVDKVWWGGHVNEVSVEEAAALTAAGYTLASTLAAYPGLFYPGQLYPGQE